MQCARVENMIHDTHQESQKLGWQLEKLTALVKT
jgi:hypothetical protein